MKHNYSIRIHVALKYLCKNAEFLHKHNEMSMQSHEMGIQSPSIPLQLNAIILQEYPCPIPIHVYVHIPVPVPITVQQCTEDGRGTPDPWGRRHCYLRRSKSGPSVQDVDRNMDVHILLRGMDMDVYVLLRG